MRHGVVRTISFRTLWRRPLAVLVFVGFMSLIVWVVAASFQERPVDPSLRSTSDTFEPKSYYLVVDSVDELSGLVHIHAYVMFEKPGPMWGWLAALSDRKPDELNALLKKANQEKKELQLSFSPLVVSDLAQDFYRSGLGFLQSDLFLNTFLSGAERSSRTTQEVPEPAQLALNALGNPRLYPFDRYLVMGTVRCEAQATLDGNDAVRVRGDKISIDARPTGFLLRKASGYDLEHWPIAAKPARAKETKKNEVNDEKARERWKSLEAFTASDRYQPQLWRETRFALILQRPLFLRFSTAFLGLVALLSLVYVGIAAEPKQFLLNAAGYFLALSSIRGTLSASAPRILTLIDYGVLVLYAVLVAIMLAKLIWGFKAQTKQA